MKNYSLFSVVAFSSVLVTGACKTMDKQPRPNIIFILTDDQRWDALGYAGNNIIQTPEMDKLAEEGTYFTNAFRDHPNLRGKPSLYTHRTL